MLTKTKLTKTFISCLAFFQLLICGQFVAAQQKEITPNLSNVNDSEIWRINSWSVAGKEEIHINKKLGDGLVYLNKFTFGNGTIEVDIKGKDEQGRNFVGVAFHILNDSNYDVVYFRPFNFENPTKKSHSVQYVSRPEFTWDKLRKEYPGTYESNIAPVPNPNDWFHATIQVGYPMVQVFINHSQEPSLVVKQLSNRKQGMIGFWIPENSEGSFRNLKITPIK